MRIIILAICSALLAGCGSGGLTKSEGGSLIGAVAGGILGNQVGKGSGRVVATAVGAVIGGIVGSEIGRSLDEADRLRAQEAEYRALEYNDTGVASPWRNQSSGHYGSVVPGRPYLRGGLNCREYTHTIYVQGRPQTMRGTACRQPDGTWRNVG